MAAYKSNQGDSMALETGSFISALVSTNPLSSDLKSAGDDHIRFVKAKILETFPAVTGAVTPTHTELNYVDGVTSAIQTQIDSKAAHAGQVYTGAHDFTGATPRVPTQTQGDNSTKPASTAYADTIKAYATGLSFASALPGQTGNAGKFVTTDGTTASWGLAVGDTIYKFTNLGGF